MMVLNHAPVLVDEIHSPEAQQKVIDGINAMSLEEIAQLWRFAPSGHIFFDSRYPYYDTLEARFRLLGGWTAALSKKVGWDNA